MQRNRNNVSTGKHKDRRQSMQQRGTEQGTDTYRGGNEQVIESNIADARDEGRQVRVMMGAGVRNAGQPGAKCQGGRAGAGVTHSSYWGQICLHFCGLG